MKKSLALKNIFFSLLLQLVNIISYFIIPKIILTSFGSETNGLVSSLNQFLNYIGLFEGGLSSVILANLYKPLKNLHSKNPKIAQKSEEKLSAVISASNKIYRFLSLIFTIYTLALAIIYPLVVPSSFDFAFVSSLTLILSLTLFAQYCFAITPRLLLQADKKVYYVSVIQIVCTILSTVSTIFIVKIFPNIHILKLLAAFAYFLQPILFNHYLKTHYPFLTKTEPDKKVMSQRWDGFGINIAAFIHNNTDIVILTLFTDLINVSIYSVYFIVTNGLRRIYQAIDNALQPSLGHAYASVEKFEKIKDSIPEKIEKNKTFKVLITTFEKYEFYFSLFIYFVFTLGALLITPFVSAYTNDISDANYFQPIFGYLLILGEFAYALRTPYCSLTYVANKFKDISKYAYIESILNIVLSVILVFNFGLIGVALGTLISMLYRSLAHIFYLKSHILNYSLKPRLKLHGLLSLASGISIFLSLHFFNFDISSYSAWIFLALKSFALTSLIFLLIIFIFFRQSLPKKSR
ncbi:MAG: polysaccharide biosynthesis C-terminal domain-containing protein [Candidatus Saccharibacteria bacterium]|nr:polysaccharide biosynthesis C-terminal domain-containing protein [Candidatus Saccharibacteria bacterium]